MNKNLQVFEYVMFAQERTDSDGNVVSKGQILGHGQTLAQSERTAMMSIARDIPEEWVERIDEIEVVVRPF